MPPSSYPLRHAGAGLLRSLRHPQAHHQPTGRLSLSSFPRTLPLSSTANPQKNSSFSTTAIRQDSWTEDIDERDNRSSINTDRNEYSKSGTDNAVASLSSAWDISFATPEQAREGSEIESHTKGDGKVSPLDISPANQEVSRFTDEDGRGVSVVHGPSRRVSPRKGRKVDYGGRVVGPEQPEQPEQESLPK